MTINLLLVAIGGFLGACARYGFSTWFNKRYPAILPRATLLINLSGSFLLGLLAGAAWGDAVYLLIGTGFMGAYTTFSTFNVENIQLVRNKEWKALLIYVAASYVLGLLLAYAGISVGMTMKG
ncbi:fluoride efflux transporter CrcB [Paenibacillus doosanensis]|uniref:Fluoride-specific ion channel FluC n=1 Tax=Paenibacillus konkukensis TaxID=2020716 RepID=A0ABY4RIP2_9BACL|nr:MULTISPECIES: fluoride efflux transporter CrcB [Paenibacillus]MCS7461938.1 fluoride efflux transporter CrcB [Paenibacillus doosanensis]UQZ81449.1 Putative fluoride ion transporter CrcB [Paenibacillus konkukensis]